MSDKGKINTIDRSVIENMSVETLRSLLQDDFNAVDGILDTETLLYATEVLSRKENRVNMETPNLEESLEEFKQEYLSQTEKTEHLCDAPNRCERQIEQFEHHKSLKPKMKAAMIIAAVVAVMMAASITASAMGFNLWDTIVAWTRDTFGLTEQIDESENETPSQLGRLRDVLGEYGITGYGRLPTYLPAGYEEENTQCMDLGEFTVFSCVLGNGENQIILDYRQYMSDDDSVVYQKDDGELEEYMAGGINHYITSNEGKYLCVWIDESIECSISGVDSREELIKIIDSIYGEKK